MSVRRRLRLAGGLGLALVLPAAAIAAPAPPEPGTAAAETAPPATPAPPLDEPPPVTLRVGDAAQSAPSPSSADEAVVGPAVVDLVLPSGVRFIAARDDSLPVAAVVLAVDAGSEDDPAELPGLTHALAYHLLQGNHELAPGAVTTLVHDAGGVSLLASGPAQTRFESLVPLPALPELLTAEAQRLRGPTLAPDRWNDALTWASRDLAYGRSVPFDVIAAAHGVPGLGHDGRVVTRELMELTPTELGAHLASRFTYDRATMVVVAPGPLDASLTRAQALFADLPPRPRQLRDRRPKQRLAPAPRDVEVEGGTGQAFVWPLAPDPAALEWGRVWCRALNRQRVVPDEPKQARVRCHLDEDPRRPLFVLRVGGTEAPLPLLEARLRRLAGGADKGLLETQRAIVVRDLERTLAQPLPLARRLAAAAPRAADDQGVMVGRDVLTGLASLRSSPPEAFLPALRPGAAVRLVAPASPET